jgi:hypothetical protein
MDDNGNHAVSIPAPRVTGLTVKTSSDPEGQPLSMQFDSENGRAAIVVNEAQFIEQVFRGLEIKAGKYKGRHLSEEVVNEAIKLGRELLAKEDLFEEGVAEQYDDFQKNIAARLVSPVEAKRKELKSPVNEIGKIFQGMPVLVLGELLSIQDDVKTRNKAYKVEKERRDREAAQADEAWQTETTGQLVMVSGLVGSLTGSSSEKIKATLEELENDNFEPHEKFADQYADAVAGTKTTLATMLNAALKAEAEAEARAKAEAERQAERDAELKRLQAEKAEQELKDAANKAMLSVTTIYAEAVGGTVWEIGKAHGRIEDIIIALNPNNHFDKASAVDYLLKTEKALKKAQEAEDRAAEAEANMKADREKEEADRARQERYDRGIKNDELLREAGYLHEEAVGGYYKKGRRIFESEDIWNVDSEFVRSEIKRVDKVIFDEEAAAETAAAAKAEAEAEKEAAEEKARKEAEANRDAAEKAMAEAIFALDDHESIIAAIIAGDIPHVRFDTAPAEKIVLKVIQRSEEAYEEKDCRDALSCSLRYKDEKTEIEFFDGGAPEDANLARDFKGVWFIPNLVKTAYNAGIAGAKLDFTMEESDYI